MVLIDAAEKVGFDRTMAHAALMDSALTDRVIAEGKSGISTSRGFRYDHK